MKLFFSGWRRKTGVVTLLFVCAVTLFWVRSIWACDELSIKYGPRQLVLSSALGRCHLMERTPLPKQPIIVQLGGRLERVTSFTLAGNGRRVFAPIEATHDTLCLIDYPSIAIPLTLLSAYLLLGKRKSNPDN